MHADRFEKLAAARLKQAQEKDMDIWVHELLTYEERQYNGDFFLSLFISFFIFFFIYLFFSLFISFFIYLFPSLFIYLFIYLFCCYCSSSFPETQAVLYIV